MAQAQKAATAKAEPKSDDVVVAYKGFSPDLTCHNGFQYEIGKTYTFSDHPVRCGSGGGHACDFPFDVWIYFSACDATGRMNRFARVEARGAICRKGADDTKFAASSLHITAELSLLEFIKSGVEWILKQVDFKNAPATNTGNRSAATNTGDRSAATNTGNCSAATNTGYQSAATNTGNYSAATNTGSRSAATNTGNRSAATNTGNYSAATNTGNCSAATNTGDRSAAKVEGKDSIAIASGYEGRVCGPNGCALVAVERNDEYKIISIASGIVGKNGIKPDTWYWAKNGKLAECGS